MKMLIKGVLLLTLILSQSALALTLNEAREQGRVGETLNGYLGAVKQDAETLELVTKINATRAQVYQQLADKNQLTRDDVARMAGQKLVNKAGRGEYVRGLNGQWLKKE
ncbi:YdbL family protein [uncultured Cedecea sp.]|uniref:YdbL family protein n=1 Tax=uncultured Cedecea sp. TaxID=988762 RepID=UPI00260ECE6D|nr:YdbL family protein [uncultured Cedecea sp.]